MPYYSFSTRIGFNVKTAKRLGTFTKPIKDMKVDIKHACMQVYEGIQSAGYENLWHTQEILVLKELRDADLFIPNEKGKDVLPE